MVYKTNKSMIEIGMQVYTKTLVFVKVSNIN